MKDLNELIETRKAKVGELENITNKAVSETRELTTEENALFETIENEIKDIDIQVEEKRNINNNKNIIIKKSNKMENNFSLLQSIRNVVEGRNNDDATLAYLEKGKESFLKSGLSPRGQIVLPMAEYRTAEVLAGTATYGQEVVAEDKFALLPYLRANSVLVASGAQLLTNLVGDVSIPYISSGTTASWKTEVAIATEWTPLFSEVTLSPKRLTFFVDISKQFLVQDSIQAEAMIRNDIMSALADKLENTLLGTAAGSTTQPAGMFYGASTTYSGATTWANAVALETAVANNNALRNNASYLIHPSAVGNLKTTSKAGTEAMFIIDGNTLNGYPYYVTTNMPTTNTDYRGVIFGVMSDMIIGQWGGLDLTVDSYSQAIYGKIRIVANAYFDGAKRRSASFAYGYHLVS